MVRVSLAVPVAVSRLPKRAEIHVLIVKIEGKTPLWDAAVLGKRTCRGTKAGMCCL